MTPGKWRNLLLLAVAELLAMTLWFSASAVVPQLTREWDLGGATRSWLTMSVQLGFVAGALLSALLNLADRIAGARLVAASAILGGLANLAIPVLEAGPGVAIFLRFLTGMCLAGVYPPGMKIVATWCREDRGLGIGVLVGALTLVKASPHLINAVSPSGMPPWKDVLFATSFLAVVGGLLAWTTVRPGPHLASTAPFDWRFAGRAFMHPPTRLANFGYLGHMWELYAMWSWVPIMLIASYGAAGWSARGARVAGFAAVGIGAAGCILAGRIADRMGRTAVASASLVLSGACCLLVGFFFDSPGLVTLVCLVWGFAVVADSAQFSAAVSELTDPRYVGTALTVQTCLGFLLTMITIHLVPALAGRMGWERVFILLAPGPVFGIWSMIRLRSLPEARAMASGNR